MRTLTVDVEDYYSLVSRDLLGIGLPVSARLDSEMGHLLELLDELEVRATCFVVGRVAKERPHLVREIAGRGHEVASHSFEHLKMELHSPRSFEQDLKDSIKVLEAITGTPIHGFRAPAFSLTSRQRWAFEIMAESGIRYDSSVRIVWPWGGRHGASMIKAAKAVGIREYPGVAMGWSRFRAPLGGGGGLRHLPAALNRWGMEHVRRKGYGVPIYIHPYDLSTSGPSEEWPAAGWTKRIRCKGFVWTQRRGRSKVAKQVAQLVGQRSDGDIEGLHATARYGSETE